MNSTVYAILLISIWVGSSLAIRQSRWDDLLRCNFDTDDCYWLVQDSSHYNRLLWRLGGRTFGRKTGPYRDHVFSPDGQRDGRYMVMDTRQFRYRFSSSQLTSPAISTESEEACLHFWYFLHGYDVGHLNVWKVRERKEREKLFSSFGPMGPIWYKASIPVGRGQNFTLQIEGTYNGSRGQGNIAVDDIGFSEYGPCPDNVDDKPQFDCDFERDTCSWYYDGPWTTYRHGQNKALELSDRVAGQSRMAYIRSPTISVLDTAACLGFTYALGIFASTALPLEVVQIPYGENPTAEEQVLAVLTKRRFASTREYVTVPGGENFYIVFRSAGSGVFLDDISMSFSGPCLSSVSDTLQLRMYYCTFEDDDACLWSQRPLPSVGRWKRHTGSTPTAYTGPEADHTTGHGYYLYLDASQEDNAQLYSPIVNIAPRQACLTFWYYMFGEDINKMTVWRYKHMEPVEERRRVVLRTFVGQKGDRWIQHNVTIPSGENVAVVIEATRSYFTRGDIAIDDILLNFDGACEYETEPATARSSTPPNSPSTLQPENSLRSSSTGVTETGTEETSAEQAEVPTPEIQVTGDIDPALTSSRVVLECGNRSFDMSYEWKLDNTSYRYADSIVWGHRLVLEDVGFQDQNVYRCRAWRRGEPGALSQPVTVTVEKDTRPKPEMHSYGVTDPAVVGSTIMLNCGDEMDRVSYNWSYFGDNSTFESVTDNRFLVLENLDKTHQGYFRCSVGKDGVYSGMSNPIRINIVRGRHCQSPAQCEGSAYTGRCHNSRCECYEADLLTDTGCRERPPTPIVTVAANPVDIGDNIHFSCKSPSVIRESATFEFHKDGKLLNRETGADLLHIHTVRNVSQQDSGSYTCSIRDGTLISWQSDPANVTVEDLADLSCDFEANTCDWFQPSHPHMTGFRPEGPETTRGSYIGVHQPKGSNGATAVLQSPFIKAPSQQACLRFMYRLQDPEPHSLSFWVYNKAQDAPSDVPALGQVLWETVVAGPAWKAHEMTVSGFDHFYMMFKAQGNVDLDDILFSSHGTCETV